MKSPRSVWWLRKLVHVGLYSGSRLAANLSGVLVSLIALRLLPTDRSHVVVLALTVAAFLSNCFASWKEQTLYRFSGPGLRRTLRWCSLAEFGLVVLLLAWPWDTPWIGHFGKPFAAGILSVALLSVCDAGYRSAVVCLQMLGRDHLFIALNYTRAAAEISLASTAILLGRDALLTVAAVRGAFWVAAAALEFASRRQLDSSHVGESGWPRYAGMMFAWMLLIQLVQYLPQLALNQAHMTDNSKQVFASYRLFCQALVMGGALIMLYVHPKLLQVFRSNGAATFDKTWVRWLKPYTISTMSLVIVVSLGFPLFLRITLPPHFSYSRLAYLVTAPGIACLALANYVQKLIEVRKKLTYILVPLLFVTLVLIAALWWSESHSSGAETLAPRAALASTLSLSLYLGLVCLLIQLYTQVPHLVLVKVRRIGFTAGFVFTGALILFIAQ